MTAFTLATWNCNSIRARHERLLQWLATRKPDVVCLQELKCTDEQFPAAELQSAGYHSGCYGQKTYNGVAILSRHPLEDVRRGLSDGVDDPQARVVSAKVLGVRVVCVYAPNGQEVGSPAYQYKLEWYRRLRTHLDQAFSPDEPLAVCGDFNVAPTEADVHDPALWEGQVLFSAAERQALAQLQEFGLADCFRKLHPEAGRFTWWDYRMLAFPKNRGLRIDHLLATGPLAQRCVECDIDREERKGKQPSDHAPVWARFSAPAGSPRG